jgi:accessory colonization factor AcfC
LREYTSHKASPFFFRNQLVIVTINNIKNISEDEDDSALFDVLISSGDGVEDVLKLLVGESNALGLE